MDRRNSVASVGSDSVGLADEEENSSQNLGDITKDLDEIVKIIRQVHSTKRQTTSKQLQQVQARVNNVKNIIINSLIPLMISDHKSSSMLATDQNIASSHIAQPTLSSTEWPPLRRGKQPTSAVIVPAPSTKQEKFNRDDADQMEREFNDLLSTEKVDATIISSGTTRKGDIIINFDKKANVRDIASKVESRLGVKAQARGLLLPKMTITRVPKYIYTDDKSAEELIFTSNPWLHSALDTGETFEVLFSYEDSQWRHIVCRVSPGLRTFILERDGSLRLQNRSCQVKDRLHVLQCGKCLRFGHKTRNCSQNTVSCNHCGEGHFFNDCPSKDDASKRCCTNCKEMNTDNSKYAESACHNARSHSCPIYKFRLKNTIQMTNWGDGPPPAF